MLAQVTFAAEWEPARSMKRIDSEQGAVTETGILDARLTERRQTLHF